MPAKPMWIVRAEVGGRYFEEFKTLGIVAIGWPELGDFTALRSRDEFVKVVQERWPSWNRRQVAMSASQLYRFACEMAVDDRVLTYDPSNRVYLVGTIESEHIYNDSLLADDPNLRRVVWEGEVSRDGLSVATRNSLGAISTLFQLPPEAAAEIEQRLVGVVAPHASASLPATPQEDEVAQVDALLKDTQDRALEFIKDRIGRLDWDEVQDLVAGLLRAMGYKTRVSPSGSDRGKDIVASPDGFGFESPRIVVEVKHRLRTQMGSQDIRSFLGGRHKDDKGLYVSTGGFSREARYETERANIPVTLLDLDDLARALVEHYERVDAEAQRLLPLRKVYWPTDG